MNAEFAKTVVATGWVFGACALTLYDTPTSVGGWTLLTAVTLFPPLVFTRFWRPSATETVVAAPVSSPATRWK